MAMVAMGQADSISISNGTNTLDITYDSGNKYSFVKSNIRIEKVIDNVLIWDDKRRLELDYNVVKSPVVSSASELFDTFAGFSNTNSESIASEIQLSIDVSIITTDTILQIPSYFTKSPYGLQSISESLTGTLDGEIEILYSQDGSNWDAIDNSSFPIVLNATPYTFTVVDAYFPITYFGIRITKNNLTGGLITFNITK